MADKRAFATFDVGYFDNPKLEAMLVAMPRALLMHMRSILYASQHLTDGEVPPALMQMRVGGSTEDTEALIEAGVWHRPGHDCPECPQPSDKRVYVHNYLEHNRSKADAKRLSERAAKAADTRWGNATSTASSNATSTKKRATSNAKSGNKQCTDRQTDIKSSRAKPKTPFPAEWTPTESHAAKAAQLSLNLQWEAEKFEEHHRSKDNRYADWGLAFHTWLKHAAEYQQRNGTAPRPQSTFDPWASDWSEDDIRRRKNQ